jgi:hypothetical protein
MPAGDIPGLFPEIPELTTVETKVESPPPAEPPPSKVDEPKPAEVVQLAKPSVAPRKFAAPASVSTPRPTASPAAPVSRSSVTTSSFNVGQLIIPLAGIAVVGMIAAGVYFVLPLLQTKAANAKLLTNLQTMLDSVQTALTDVQSIRKKSDAKKEDFQVAASKLETVAKSIEAETRGATSDLQKELWLLSKALQRVAQQSDLRKPAEAERTAEKRIVDLQQRLKEPPK